MPAGYAAPERHVTSPTGCLDHDSMSRTLDRVTDRDRTDREDQTGSPDSSLAEPPRMPTWVKASLVAAAVITLALLVALLTGGEHGPGRHLGSPDSVEPTAPAAAHSGAELLRTM